MQRPDDLFSREVRAGDGTSLTALPAPEGAASFTNYTGEDA